MKKNLGKLTLLFAMVMLSGIGFSGCKDKNSGPTPVTQQDRAFIANTSAANTAEIQFGNLALLKSTSDSVKTFARMMVTEHTRGIKQLDSISSSLNVQRFDSMDSAHKTIFKSLSGLGIQRFDSVYLYNQVLDHQSTQVLMQNEISNGTDAKLVEYARKQLPVVTRHLQRVTNLSNYMRNNTPANTNPVTMP